MANRLDDLGKPAQINAPRPLDNNLDDPESVSALKKIKDGTGSMWKAAMSLLSSWYGAGDDHSNSPHIDL